MKVMQQQVLWVVIAGGLLWGAFAVLGPFLTAAAWAGVLTLVTWPLYIKLWPKERNTWTALAMTGAVALAVFVPVVILGAILAQEGQMAYRSFKTGGPADLTLLFNWVGTLPWFGPQLQSFLQAIDGPQVQAGLQARLGQIFNVLGGIGREVSSALITLGLTLFTMFFFYRSGEDLTRQLTRGLDRLGGEALSSLLIPLADTVRSVVLGLIVTALAQGALAGLGMAVAGVRLAVLLGVLTALVAIPQIPTFLVWFPCVVWLLANGQMLQGLGLLAWGTLVVSTIDNVLKPIFISQGSGIPFLLVFFGVLGGLLAFGSLGIVLGPVILSLLVVLWRRWIAEDSATV